jgi:hypothetical protein
VNHNLPQETPHGKGREITPLVIKDLEMRSSIGKEKYGEALRAFNGRDPMVDLYQELIDAVQYIRQAIEERNMSAERGMEVPSMTAREYILHVDAAFTVGRESVAEEAHRLVLGDRGESYGHPIFDMTRSADMLTALLRSKLRPGARLEAEDIGQAMVCVKQSRHRNKPKRDNLTDTAGYALTLQMIAEWRAQNPGIDPRDVFPAE